MVSKRSYNFLAGGGSKNSVKIRKTYSLGMKKILTGSKKIIMVVVRVAAAAAAAAAGVEGGGVVVVAQLIFSDRYQSWITTGSRPADLPNHLGIQIPGLQQC